MRGFECYYYHRDKDKLIQNTNISCWAGLQKYYHADSKIARVIYIDRYTEADTSKYIPLLIRIINKITPCKLVPVDNVTYIRFDLLDTYDQSLVLLNFIRNLWSQQKNNFAKADMVKYTEVFFETLKNAKLYKDPVKRLTHANILASEEAKLVMSLGHSNAHNPKVLVVRDLTNLLEYKGNSTLGFLQGK